MGGDGSLRGARAIYETFGIQVVGIPGTIDNNIDGTTSLGFHSAVALANQSIESLKATSSAMGSVFFVEVMGAGSGHLALACAYQARAEGILVNEHPDPDAYIDAHYPGNLEEDPGRAQQEPFIRRRGAHSSSAPPRGRRPRVGGLRGSHHRTVAATAGKSRPVCSHPVDEGHHSWPYVDGARHRLPKIRLSPSTWPTKMVRRLVEQPETIVGCMVAYRDHSTIETIPLHAVTPKQFDWELFTRMHGGELTQSKV